MTSRFAGLALAACLAGPLQAQTPQPFPRPDQPARPQPGPAGREGTPPVKVLPPDSRQPAADPVPAAQPAEDTLGLPVYPGGQFLTSYDAGRGQRFYLYGVNTDFAQVVGYYRNVLRQRGDLAYEQPPIHTFEVGRFREETMAFSPGVTVKDYTWGGSEGYMHVAPGAAAARYRTIIQIVPAPAAAR